MEDAADGRPAGWVMALPSSMFLVEDAAQREEAESAGKKKKSAGVNWMVAGSSFLYLLRGKKWKILRAPNWMKDSSSLLYLLKQKQWKMLRTQPWMEDGSPSLTASSISFL